MSESDGSDGACLQVVFMPLLMFHEDGCGVALDKNGVCPKCNFAPDMQSTGFREVATVTLVRDLTVERRSFLGQFGIPIERHDGEEDD